MPVCKDSLEGVRKMRSGDKEFRAAVMNMSYSMVQLAEQCKELSSIVKSLNERVLVLESTREQVRFKPPYIEK